MSYSDQFYFDSTNIVLFEGPVNEFSGEPVTEAQSADLLLFHDAKDSFLRSPASSGDLVLEVSNARRYSPSRDRVVVWGDDSAWHDLGICQAVDLELSTVTVESPLPVDSDLGQRVAVALGGDLEGERPWRIAMSPFEPPGGALPVAGMFDYGFRGVIPPGQEGFEIGAVCRCEIAIVVGENLKVTKTLRRHISGGV